MLRVHLLVSEPCTPSHTESSARVRYYYLDAINQSQSQSLRVMAHQHGYPPNLPVPVDDGACQHLQNQTISPNIRLIVTYPASTKDNAYSSLPRELDVAELSQTGLVLIFIYPRTAPPNEDVPEEWNAIPGARGCTPQNCARIDGTDARLLT